MSGWCYNAEELREQYVRTPKHAGEGMVFLIKHECKFAHAEWAEVVYIDAGENYNPFVCWRFFDGKEKASWTHGMFSDFAEELVKARETCLLQNLAVST